MAALSPGNLEHKTHTSQRDWPTRLHLQGEMGTLRLLMGAQSGRPAPFCWETKCVIRYTTAPSPFLIPPDLSCSCSEQLHDGLRDEISCVRERPCPLGVQHHVRTRQLPTHAHHSDVRRARLDGQHRRPALPVSGQDVLLQETRV